MFLGHQFFAHLLQVRWSEIPGYKLTKIEGTLKGKPLKREETDCCLINPALV